MANRNYKLVSLKIDVHPINWTKIQLMGSVIMVKYSYDLKLNAVQDYER
ncbi:MAG TPA: hypothetical protein VGC17_07005 [Lactovum miscens]